MAGLWHCGSLSFGALNLGQLLAKHQDSRRGSNEKDNIIASFEPLMERESESLIKNKTVIL